MVIKGREKSRSFLYRYHKIKMDIKTRIKLNKQELAFILALHFNLDPEKTVFIPHFEKGDRPFDSDYWSFEVEGEKKHK